MSASFQGPASSVPTDPKLSLLVVRVATVPGCLGPVLYNVAAARLICGTIAVLALGAEASAANVELEPVPITGAALAPFLPFLVNWLGDTSDVGAECFCPVVRANEMV